MSKYVTDEIIADVASGSDEFFKRNKVTFYSNRYQEWLRIETISHYQDDYFSVTTRYGKIIILRSVGIDITADLKNLTPNY